MEYEIAPSADGEFMVIKIKGSITGAAMIKIIQEAHVQGQQAQVSRYLCDVVDARNAESVIGNYSFAYTKIRETPGINTTARVALLVAADDHSHDFVESLMKNSGQNVRLFRDRVQAEAHLRK
jgi:hypothetical protein